MADVIIIINDITTRNYQVDADAEKSRKKMKFCQKEYIWNKTLRVNTLNEDANRQYTIQLTRHVGFFTEDYRLLVNGQEIEHRLSSNSCSPLCLSGGVYGWEQDGHQFLIMYNNLALIRELMGYRLFIDGIEVETGLAFRAFWRRRGLQFVQVGLLIMAFGAVATLLFHTAVIPVTSKGMINGAYGVLGVGAVYILLGVIPFLRNYHELRYSHGNCIITV